MWLTITTDALAAAVFEAAEPSRVDVHQFAWPLAVIATHRLANRSLSLQTETARLTGIGLSLDSAAP